MRSRNRPVLGRTVLLLATAVMVSNGWLRDARAQDKAADVFDAEPAKTDDAKPADPAKAPAVTDRDSIGFTQENVTAQMTELEERLFRLSEALRSLEPENASRLRLALKFSREELILQQMKEAQKLLREAQLGKAETEARELLAKLEHLRSLLLAEDLDFQMKLARLRQMRETMNQLERIIKEERRELAWSRSAAERQAGRNPPDARAGEPEKEIAPAEFRRFEQDQARNRAAAASLAAASARLGNSGVPLQKDLIRAGGSMRAAEQELEKTAAKPAAVDQLEALKHLSKGSDALAKSLESLLVELRSELQTRIISELSEMHEIQMSIRETTEAQAARAATKSRTALIILAGMSRKEAELVDRMEHLRALAVETEFGIALPTSLHVVAREMTKVQGWLKEGDATARTVATEKRIEEDLLALVEAMRRLPPTTPPPPGTPLPTNLKALERELNRLIAELKMIRLIQSRLNDDTTTTDKSRPKVATLPPELRSEVEALKVVQEEIRDSLKKIAAALSAPEDDAMPEIPGIPGLPKEFRE